MRIREWMDLTIMMLIVFIPDVSDASTTSTTTVQAPARMSWMEGYLLCNNSGLALPSPRLGTRFNRRPLWTFGLAVTRHYTDGHKTIQVESRVLGETALPCCVNQESDTCSKLEADSKASFTECSNRCKERNSSSLMFIEGDSAHKNFLFGNLRGHWFWARQVNVMSLFLGDNITVKCALNDGSGTVKVDDCLKKHWVVCANDTFDPVFYLPKLNESTYNQYDPTSNAGTSAKPFDSSSIPTERKGSATPTAQTTEHSITNPNITAEGIGPLPADFVYLIAGIGAAIVLTMLILCCCCCCRRKRRRDDAAVVFEAYSDAVDSVTAKDDQGNHALYAVPDDAIPPKNALPRTSITEEEYDVLGKTDRPDKQPTGNVYSHITMGSNRKKKKKKSKPADIEDATYDVTSYNKTVPGAAPGGEEVYEELQRPGR